MPRVLRVTTGSDKPALEGRDRRGRQRPVGPAVLRRRSSVWLVAAVLLFSAALVAVYAARPSDPPADRPELQQVLDRLVTGDGRIAPGATAYVSGPNGTWVGSAGIADVKTGQPMSPGARMRLESVSKAWTATLILQLVGEGKMRLDDPVARWLPGLLPHGDLITTRQLLNHTAGLTDRNDIGLKPAFYIRQITDPRFRAELRNLEKRIRSAPALEYTPMLWIRFVAALPLRAPPGSQYHYANVGYEIAGLIAEKVSGESLSALYRERIIDPLGLTSAAYDPQGEIAGPHARGYLMRQRGGLVDATAWHGGIGAEGGIVADARDEARFLTALMRGKILQPAQLAAMKTPPASIGSTYALGLVVDQTACGTAYQHNGGGPAFKTSAFVSGDGRRVTVLLLNGNTRDARADAAAYRAAKRLYCAA